MPTKLITISKSITIISLVDCEQPRCAAGESVSLQVRAHCATFKSLFNREDILPCLPLQCLLHSVSWRDRKMEMLLCSCSEGAGRLCCIKKSAFSALYAEASTMFDLLVALFHVCMLTKNCIFPTAVTYKGHFSTRSLSSSFKTCMVILTLIIRVLAILYINTMNLGLGAP